MHGVYTGSISQSKTEKDRNSNQHTNVFPSEVSPIHNRRPVPSYVESGSLFSEPMGMIQSPRYTYAVNNLPEPPNYPHTTNASRQLRFQYKHSQQIAGILLPTGILILSHHQSLSPVLLFLIVALVVYALDLVQSRVGVLYTTWFAVPVLALTTGWCWLMAEGDGGTDESGWRLTRILFHTVTVGFYWTLVAAWGTLQFRDWLTDYPLISRQMETCIHSTVPLTVSSLLCYITVYYLNTNFGPDLASTSAPHIFALLLWLCMSTAGSCQSSILVLGDNNNGHNDKRRQQKFVIPNIVAQVHLVLLLVLPPCMHLLTFWRRLTSRMADFDDWFDWYLALAIPYLLMVSLKVLSQQKIIETPYARLPLLRQSIVLPLCIVFLTSLAIQHRYVIPLVHQFSYHYTGTKHSSWMLCLYWTFATIILIVTTWLWGRKEGKALLGEYHEDALQLLLSLLGLFLGKAVGMPWNFAPLPILAFLGVCLWFTTRLLRYLGIVVFVFLATSFVTFTYRFAGIDHTLVLPFPLRNISLVGFSMTIVTASALMFLVTGLAIRAPGGFLSSFARQMDLPGLCLIGYVIILMELEIALIKKDSTWQHLIGVHMIHDSAINDVLYTPALAVMTSLVLIGVSHMMKYFDMIRISSSWTATAFCCGKAFAIYLDNLRYKQNMNLLSTTDILFDGVLSGISFIIMVVPHVFLRPVHVKASTRYQRSIAGGAVLTSATRRTIFIYASVVLPFAIFLAEYTILEPLLVLMLNKSNLSNSGATMLLLGICTCMWGLSFLSMLNHLLPDGGAEVWKKVTGFIFLLGVMICCTFPMLSVNSHEVSRTWNPYRVAALSTIGRDLLRRNRSRTGEYGILSSVTATLLAVMGPLNLNERRGKSGGKDQLLLLRTTIFSILFGGGLTWFIIIQMMNESDALVLIFTSISSMMIAFLCTVTSALGYYVDLENFTEVEQVANTIMVAFVVFFFTAGFPVVLNTATASLFGNAGCLTTYLLICSLSFCLISVSLGNRKKKDVRTRGVANFFSIFAYVCSLSVIFSQSGVAGFDENYETISVLGLPICVVSIQLVSLVLLCLEGEGPNTGSGRRLASQKTSSFFAALPLRRLRKSNYLFPFYCGTAMSLLGASLYANLLRGAGVSQRVVTDRSMSTSTTKGNETDLSILIQQIISQSQYQSDQLARSGFWTSDSFWSPLLEFIGICFTLPSLYIAVYQWWFRFGRHSAGNILNTTLPPIPLGFIGICAAMNLFPMILGTGIPTLRAASFIQLFVGLWQIIGRYNALQASHTNT